MQIKHKNSQLNDELSFLITCCQIEPSEDDINFIFSYLNGQHLELNALINLANQHGILPLVYKTIKKIVGDDSSHSSLNLAHARPKGQMPLGYLTLNAFLSELKPYYMSIVQRNMLMTSELIKIMHLLRENHIEALAFKGPVLAQLAYGDITLRQYSDLDILVDESDAFKAGTLMSENGHKAILPLSILSNKTCLSVAKDFSLMSEPAGVHTELHWHLFEKKYNIPVLSCTLENKCQTVTINNHEIITLQNEPLLVYLCLHGAKHAFERIEWICDIDRVIRNVEINWEETIALVDQSHSQRPFYLGLSLAAQLFSTKLPPEIMKNSNDYHIISLKETVLKQLSEKKKEKNTFQKNMDIYLYQSRLFNSRREQISFILNILFSVSTNDCRTFTFPTQLKFLYIVLRPIRLLYKYLKNTDT